VFFNTILSKGFDGHHYIAGLASHFRDLLVCKNEQTIALLEVGEQTKQKYLEQSRKTSQSFLLKGIEMANDCDLKYKTSKNQRLLVELCLMQLTSITFDGEKKNSKHYIVPPSYFKNKGITPIPVVKPEMVKPTEESEAIVADEVIPDIAPVSQEVASQPEENILVAEPKITLKRDLKRTSGLSLSSIKAKKEHQIKQMEVVINEEDLPSDDFTQEALKTAWNAYIDILIKKGKHNLASILNIDTPKVDGTVLQVTYPNSTNKVEVERAQYELLGYIRKTLNNYDISLDITVNEALEKQYAYSSQDKYDKLKEKNPSIELLRKTFGLDL